MKEDNWSYFACKNIGFRTLKELQNKLISLSGMCMFLWKCKKCDESSNLCLCFVSLCSWLSASGYRSVETNISWHAFIIFISQETCMPCMQSHLKSKLKKSMVDDGSVYPVPSSISDMIWPQFYQLQSLLKSGYRKMLFMESSLFFFHVLMPLLSPPSPRS